MLCSALDQCGQQRSTAGLCVPTRAVTLGDSPVYLHEIVVKFGGSGRYRKWHGSHPTAFGSHHGGSGWYRGGMYGDRIGCGFNPFNPVFRPRWSTGTPAGWFNLIHVVTPPGVHPQSTPRTRRRARWYRRSDHRSAGTARSCVHRPARRQIRAHRADRSALSARIHSTSGSTPGCFSRACRIGSARSSHAVSAILITWS